jgi:hypothetical protein
MNTQEEKALRGKIRQLLELTKRKKALAAEKAAIDEGALRDLIRRMVDVSILQEAAVGDNDPTPNKSTGINVLEDLLKKIVPVLETDYKALTTDDEQRRSFRSHIINAVVNTLTPVEINRDAEEDSGGLEEEIDVGIGGIEQETGEDDKFIDIRTDAEIAADEAPEETDPKEDFGKGVEGADETGRNMAYASFKKIESSVIDAYDLLSNPEDQELFYDYLVANLKLYFDKFEGELSPEVAEPASQAYDTAKQDLSAAGEEELELEL